jgi:hypothetical protein
MRVENSETKEHRMRFDACVGLALVSCLLSCGCGQTNLCDYAPLGTSANSSLPSLSLYLTPYFVSDPEDAVKCAQDPPPFYADNPFAFYSYVVVRNRPATPGYRSLCAVINRHFGKWERLVIIERLQYGGYDETGFIVAAVTRGGLMGVTNLGPKGPDAGLWEATLCPRAFRLDGVKFESCLAELDKARKSRKGLWSELLWFNNIDWPLYLLHDIKSDGSYLSLAVCGWGWRWADHEDADRARLLKAPLDYAKAAELVSKSPPWQNIVEGSASAKELRKAGATYASLLSLVWECTLGRPDYAILGVDPLAPPSAKPASSP